MVDDESVASFKTCKTTVSRYELLKSALKDKKVSFFVHLVFDFYRISQLEDRKLSVVRITMVRTVVF